jgi:hypothetical protein
MKKLFSLVLLCTSLLHADAQKIVKSADIKLSDFDKMSTPLQIIGLKMTPDNKMVIYTLKFVQGLLKTENAAPVAKEVPKKKESKLVAALNVDAEEKARASGQNGLPYLSQRTFDGNLQQTASVGELMLIGTKDDKLKYSFEPNSLPDGLTKKMEVKSSLKELNQKFGVALDTQIRIKAGLVSNSGLRETKASVYLATTYNIFSPQLSNGLVASTKKIETPNKEVISKKLPYIPVVSELSESTVVSDLSLSNKVVQSVVYEKKADDSWSVYKYFRLITVSNEGVLMNDENMNLPNLKTLQDLLPLFNPDGEIKGSLIVFEKQAALGNKDKKDPIDGNRNFFISDENGKVSSQFAYQHAKGVGNAPFSARAAMIKDGKIFVLNSNVVKLSNHLLETVVFDKTGKAEVTSSMPVKEAKPKVFGTVKTPFVTDASYQQAIKGENGTVFLIGQSFTPASSFSKTPDQYGDIFITEMDANFKYKSHTIVALPISGEKGRLEIVAQKAGKTIINAAAKGGTDAIIIIEGNKVNALTGIMPVGMMPPTLSDWSKNYIYDASKNVIHYFYQSKTDANKGKIVSVSLLP